MTAERASAAGGPGSPTSARSCCAPVGAIIGYQEILGEEAGRLGLEDSDSRSRARARGRRGGSHALVDQPARGRPGATGRSTPTSPEFEAKLRHDLRTPLNAIMGYGELMLEELEAPDADPLRPDLERLLDEARRLLAAVDLIVDLSRDGSRRRPTTTRPPRWRRS